MTRIKALFAAVAVAAIVALAPAANAQCNNVHFVGSGSSAQWQMAALGADQLAVNENAASYHGLGYSVTHWTGKNLAYVADSRDSRILPELGNLWVVWIGDSSGNCYDLWEAISVDSTVGVRTFSIQESASVSGGEVYLSNTVTTTTGGSGSIANGLWADPSPSDTDLTTAVINSIGTGSASGPTTAGQHVNVGMTDIRPEDALFATNRSVAALNTTTWAGLGYVGPTKYIGAPIYTNQGTGTVATPIGFALSGKPDPITKFDVPAYTTVPIGAAPIIFITNNNGTPVIFNLVSGVVPDATGGPYSASKFFGGEVPCDTHASAFGGNDDGAGTPLTVFLREPLSGTMNTTEFNVFRSVKNPDGSQETGVINPTRTPYNPLSLGCPTHGSRSRAIGTGEVVGKAATYGLLGNPNSIGYIFYGFANASKLIPNTNFNYLTLDGVDPIGQLQTCTGGSNNGTECSNSSQCTGGGTCGPFVNPTQLLPSCGQSTQPACPSSLFVGGQSFPTLRNGTYKAWSVYRWLITTSLLGSDPYGLDAVAQSAQDYVDTEVADFVPFLTCPSGDTAAICGGQTNVDGLSVYRSHFVPKGVASGTADNGIATPANALNNGNTLGGGPENGGDVGGFIEGPFGITTNVNYAGTVTTTATLTKGKGYKVSWKTGTKFTAGTAWEGGSITIDGVGYTIANVAVTATVLYVTADPGVQTGVSYSASFPVTFGPATAPGVLNKHQ